MSVQETPLTYESLLKLILETRESIQETRESIRESERARVESERAREKAELERERAREKAEQERERMREKAEQERKKEEQEREQAREKAEQEREQAREKAEQERKKEEQERRKEEQERKRIRELELQQYALEWRKGMDAVRKQMKEAGKKISALGSRIGDIIECMVKGGIVKKFQALNHEITRCARNVEYKCMKTNTHGEIDLFLEDGPVAILIEVKTTLQTADVRKHMERIEKFKRYSDGKGDTRRFVGAVAGAVVVGEAKEFAHENGLYVIVQSGKAVEIAPLPEGFRAREW